MCKLSRETIDDILQQGLIYEVGGAVRDRYLFEGKRIKDRDYLVTGVPYDSLTRLLARHGRVDLVGRSFGVIKFTQKRGDQAFTFDITLPRKEHSTGTGHKDFTVDFDPNLPVEEDLVRRDFTINAMALALDDDELIDPLGGKIDLEKRQIRMTSEASFKEDPLRMLRAVQFAARFEFEIESATLAAIKEHAALITTISAERINEELNKLLTRAERPSIGFRLMHDTGLLEQILPELENCVGVDQPGPYHKYDVFDHTLYAIDACPQRLRVRLAALFHDITKPLAKREIKRDDGGKGATFYGHETSGAKVAKGVMNRLRYPRHLTQEVATLVERHMFTTDVTDKGLRRLIRRVGPDLIFDLLDLRRADVEAQGMGGTTDDVDEFEANIRAELDKKPPFTYSDLAISGHDLIQMFDLKPGPIIGDILDHLMEKVLDEPDNNTREILESLAREYYLTIIAGNESKDSDKGHDE